MDTGVDLANRLLENINTSLKLRSTIPDLATLKDLIEGGAKISTQILNTSSNFGSFDSALGQVLTILYGNNKKFIPSSNLSILPLTVIYDNLSTEKVLLSNIFQDYIDGKITPMLNHETSSTFLLYRLETIALASV